MLAAAARLDRELKEQLRRELCAIIEGMSLSDAAELLGVDRTRISKIRHGSLSEVSTDRLIQWIGSCRYSVELVIRPLGRPHITPVRPSATVTRCDQFGVPVATRDTQKL